MAFRKSALLAATILGAGLPAGAHAQSGAPFTTYFRYDGQHRLTGTISPDPDGAGPRGYMAVRNSYDPAGRLTKVEKGELSSVPDPSIAPAAWGSAFTVLQTIDTAYDALDRKTRESVSDGTTTYTLTQTSYDNAGRLTCTAVRMNSAVFATVTSDACALGTSGSFGPDRIVHNSYNADGRLTAVTEGWGTGWQGNEKVLTYTASDKLETLTDGENNKTTFEYDGHDRLARTWFPVAAKGAGVSALPQNVSDPNDADYEELGYEVATVGGAARATGLVHSRRNRAGETLTFGYDALDRMTLKDRPGSEPDVAYGYDNRGLQLSASYPSTGETASSGYDNAGRLTSSGVTAGGVTRSIGYGYDADGNRQSMTYPDQFSVTYVNDGLDRVSELHDGITSALLTGFTYDALGRRQGITRGNSSSTAYEYDGASRLTSLAHHFFNAANDVTFLLGYNPASEITSRTVSNNAYVFGLTSASTAYAANGKNQMVQAGSAVPSWDKKGNLTSDGTNSYVYTSENLLSTIANPGPHSTATSLAYDPLGRLREVGSNSTALWEQLVEDHEGQVAFEVQTLSRTVRNIFGPEPDEIVAGDRLAPTFSARTWYYQDERGSVIAAEDGTGTPRINRYDDYGVPGTSNSGRFQYTGQYWLAEPSIYYYKARFYDPKLGLFLQTDPKGYDAGANLYAYVGDDPLNNVDSTGEDPSDDHKESALGTAKAMFRQAAQMGKDAVQMGKEAATTVKGAFVLTAKTVGNAFVYAGDAVTPDFIWRSERAQNRQIEAVMRNPSSLSGKDIKEVRATLTGTARWHVTGLGEGANEGGGWKMFEVLEKGQLTGRQIRWNPTSNHHRAQFGGRAYWLVNDGHVNYRFPAY